MATYQTYRFYDLTCVVTDIDRRQFHRHVPMKVLILGMCRTGTDSLRHALKWLGFNDTYHGYAATLENSRDCKMWLEGLKAKYEGKGQKFGREQFDQLLGHCQAVSDFPAVCFAEELIQAYPEAKVILTMRDVDAWHAWETLSTSRSMLKTFQPLVMNPFLPLMSMLDNLFRMQTRWIFPTYRTIWKHLFIDDFQANGRDKYLKHYENVRRLVPPERLLEYHIQEGWDPLCKFLRQPLPQVPFPSGNGTDVFRNRFRFAILYAFQEYLFKIVRVMAYVALVSWGGFLWGKHVRSAVNLVMRKALVSFTRASVNH